MKFNIEKTAQEWLEQLGSETYRILRQAGTEKTFTSALNTNYKDGTYLCKGCDTYPIYKCI